jgi:peroxiredoxin
MMTDTGTKSAPDFEFADKAGRLVRLSDLWSAAERGIVLVFLRHFGCLFCKDQVRQLKAHYDQIRQTGFEVVAIGQGSDARAARFAEDFQTPFPVYGDKERVLYRQYGLTSTRFGSFLEPDAYKVGIGAMLRGNFPTMPDGSVNQNPGVFLIDRNGQILRAHIGQHAGDFATVNEILGWIDQERSAA